MAFRLKPGVEAFTITDGPDAGKTYRPGETYSGAPAAEQHRFERVRVPAKARRPAPVDPVPEAVEPGEKKENDA